MLYIMAYIISSIQELKRDISIYTFTCFDRMNNAKTLKYKNLFF